MSDDRTEGLAALLGATLRQHTFVRTMDFHGPQIGGAATHGVRCACSWETSGHPNEGAASVAWIGHIEAVVSEGVAARGVRPPGAPSDDAIEWLAAELFFKAFPAPEERQRQWRETLRGARRRPDSDVVNLIEHFRGEARRLLVGAGAVPAAPEPAYDPMASREGRLGHLVRLMRDRFPLVQPQTPEAQARWLMEGALLDFTWRPEAAKEAPGDAGERAQEKRGPEPSLADVVASWDRALAQERARPDYDPRSESPAWWHAGAAMKRLLMLAPRTERMDLHDELDRRYPTIAEFREFVRPPDAGERERRERLIGKLMHGILDEYERLEVARLLRQPGAPRTEPSIPDGMVPLCPCGAPLRPVTYTGGVLNADQWASVRAGDWYCDDPHCERAQATSQRRHYWWDAQVGWPPNKSAVEAWRARFGGGSASEGGTRP